MSSRVLAVVGGQYGSEGKGNIVAKIASNYDMHIRTGGPNAGHSLRHKGRTWKMRMVPCGWVNPDAKLFIGPGAVVDPRLLRREIDEVAEVDPTIHSRIRIAASAAVTLPEDEEAEAGLVFSIGSTGEGVGEARARRMARKDTGRVLLRDVADEEGLSRYVIEDTTSYTSNHIRAGKSILLEGTQGFGLSLIHGHWPYVTSHDTTAATLTADAGLSPLDVTNVLLVVRTMPIRVAGTSGPLENETDWDTVGKRLGKDVTERTTVTQKIRRIADWDDGLVKRAINVNRPTSIALNFLDYLDPDIEGEHMWNVIAKSDRVLGMVSYVESRFGVPVSIVGTGGPEWSISYRRPAL